MSTNDIVTQLRLIIPQINRYMPIFLLLFGFIGNLINCFVFTQRKLRKNPCAIYFFAGSLFNLILFLSGFLPRIFDGWKPELNLTSTIAFLCQLQVFLTVNTRCIVAWITAFASIDRYLVSSINIHRRRMSNLKNTYRCLIFICIILSIIWIEIFICFDANIVGTPFKCSIELNTCRLYNDFGQIFITIIFPMFIMLIFGFFIIRNIHKRLQVIPIHITGLIILKNRRNERSLTKMLFIQIFVLTLLTLPFALFRFYLTLTSYQQKSLIQKAFEDFLFNILLLISFIPNCISFFLYTLSGSLFLEIFLELGRKTLHYLRC